MNINNKDNKGNNLKKGERKRSDGSYEFRYTDKHGIRHSKYAPTLPKLRVEEALIRKELKNGGDLNLSNITLNKMFLIWKDTKCIKENTMSNYVQYYNTHILNGLGKSKISKIKKTDIKALYKTKLNEGLTPNTIGIIHNVLHQIFETAIGDRYLDYNPTNGTMKEIENSAENGEITALTIYEEREFLNYVKNTPCFARLFPIFIVLFRTGMRIGELCGLQVEDIDFEKSVIHISHDLVYFRNPEDPVKKYRFEMHPTKTKSSIRNISFAELDDVRDALKQQIEYNRLLGIKCKQEVDGYSNFVFLNYFGDLLSYHDLNKSMDRIVKSYNKAIEKEKGPEAHKLPHITSHCCRKTFSTRTNEFSLNDKFRCSSLGHTSLRMTNNVYTKVTDDLVEENMKEFKKKLEKYGLVFSTPNI